MHGPNTPWKTEAAFWSWLRGGLRRSLWMRHPVKIGVLNGSRFKAPIGVKGKDVWAVECAICNRIARQGNAEVDHKAGNVSLKCEEDVLAFVKHLAFITPEQLQIVCKPCHKIKSMAERYGYTFEEAKERKRIIQENKNKKKDTKCKKKKRKK
ncbi:HNH endonuclease [bacterium]|nr:HNH endonuclease [bacterium]